VPSYIATVQASVCVIYTTGFSICVINQIPVLYKPGPAINTSTLDMPSLCRLSEACIVYFKLQNMCTLIYFSSYERQNMLWYKMTYCTTSMGYITGPLDSATIINIRCIRGLERTRKFFFVLKSLVPRNIFLSVPIHG
jgi:hypothetical protein